MGGLDPHRTSGEGESIPEKRSGRLWSRISSSVIIIPEIRRQQRLEERYDRGAAFNLSLSPTSRGGFWVD
ncbi:hypothetical protein OHJ21_00580 [Virgibacillus sp. LDC1]|nr:hypothetical protein [Virgibacillus sp. LDC1]